VTYQPLSRQPLRIGDLRRGQLPSNVIPVVYFLLVVFDCAGRKFVNFGGVNGSSNVVPFVRLHIVLVAALAVLIQSCEPYSGKMITTLRPYSMRFGLRSSSRCETPPARIRPDQRYLQDLHRDCWCLLGLCVMAFARELERSHR
jgi:hypothetical protein